MGEDLFRRTPIVKGQGLYIQIPLAERLRAARGVPQAIVKVIKKFGHGVKGVGKIMNYISRGGELPLETQSGTIIKDREEQRDLVRDWAVDFDQRADSRDGAHIIFSMPHGSDPDALRNAVRTVGARAFPGHEWVFAIHQNKDHPHAHMVLKMRGWDQDKKLDFKKADLHHLREVFAEAARNQGVELAASPRAARGVGQKGDRQAIRQLKEKGFRPEVEKQTVQEAVRELVKGDWKEKPWEKAMAERNKIEREAYRREAAALREAAEKQAEPAERERMLKDAGLLEQFAQRMPRSMTKRQSLKERLWQKIQEERREKVRARDRGAELEL